MAMDELTALKVPLRKTPAEYVQAIDELFAKKPEREPAPINVILASLVYTTELQSRPAMDRQIEKHAITLIKL